jgi:hypothetical protein
MAHSDYCPPGAWITHFILIQEMENSMRCLLLTTFLIAGVISTSAFGLAPARQVAANSTPESVAALQLPAESKHAKINTSYRSAQAQISSPHLTDSPANKADSGWQYLGTLLSTLALIGTIAIRRHMAGKL